MQNLWFVIPAFILGANVHNVPPEKIQEMKTRWEKYE